MTYVDAAVAPLRKTGQIKLHGPDAFEGMRKAGRLVARCLDLLVEHVGPGVPTEKIDRLRLRLRPRSRRPAGDADVSRLQEVDLHLDQPRRLPRHSRRQAAQGRRHRQYRRDADPRRLARRFQPHVRRRRDSAPRRAADRGDPRGHDARHRRHPARRDHRRHRRRDPELCRSPAYERGARLLRPRPRPPVPRRAQHRPYRPAGRRHRAQARHVLHRRADDQSRPPARESAVRRLDRGDARPFAVGAVRAHRRRHRHRRRDLHPVAGRTAQAAV